MTRIARIRSASEPAFEEAWGTLWRDNGPRGEIERREVVEGWLARPDHFPTASGLELTYELVAVYGPDGDLRAVRDHHVVVDPIRRIVVVYLAHALVLPAFRGTGLADLLRSIPHDSGTIAKSRWTLEHSELLLAGEMEPWVPADSDTTRRLISYGKGGFRAIEPSRIVYSQPDFRDLASLAAQARPIPLLAVVAGFEGRDTLPKHLGEAFIRSLHEVFATHCRSEDLAALSAVSLAAIARGGDLPLLPLPSARDDLAALEALSADRVLPLYSA